jgi:hypothetical protein
LISIDPAPSRSQQASTREAQERIIQYNMKRDAENYEKARILREIQKRQARESRIRGIERAIDATRENQQEIESRLDDLSNGGCIVTRGGVLN